MADEKFAEVTHSFNSAVSACLKLARENVKRAGGSVKTVEGKEVLFIPVQYPVAPKMDR